MATTSTTSVTEALKYTYGVDNVLYLMNEEVVGYNLFKKKMAPMGGRGQFIMPILTQNAGAWTGASEGGSLAVGLAPDTTEATFSLVEFNGTYTMSWKLIQDARSSKFAFQTALALMEQSFRRRVLRLINADLIDNGKGRLAVMPAQDDEATITVDGLPLVEKGMVVDVMDLTDDDTKLGDSLTVTAVDTVNRTVTLSAAANDTTGNTAAGDYLVIQDTTDATSGTFHTHGILGVVDDANPASVKGNFGGINRSTAGNEFWESVVLDNSGTNRPFTEDLGMQLEDAMREKSGAKVNAWISNSAILRRYHEHLKEDVFFSMSSPKALDSGAGMGRSGQSPGQGNADGKTIYRFSGVPWHNEPYFRANTIVALDTRHFFIGHGENSVPRPTSEIFDGVPFFKTTSSTTFDVNWYWQAELLSDNPAAGGKIEDISES